MRRPACPGPARLGPVGVGADQGDLPVPQRGQVDGDPARACRPAPPGPGAAPGPGPRRATRRCPRSRTPRRRPRSAGRRAPREPAGRRTARASWSGGTTGRRRARGQLALVGVLGPDQHGARGRRPDQLVRGRRRWPARACRRRRTATRSPSADAGRQRGVDGAGGRLDHDGVLVGQGVGHGVELAGVGHEPARSTSRRRCRCSSRSAARRPGGRRRRCSQQPGVARRRTRHRAGRCRGGRSRAPARPPPGSRGEGAPGVVGAAVVEHAHHLVAGDEREADTMSSKYRELRPSTVARSEPQMPDSSGRSGYQSSPGQLGRLGVEQPQRADARAPPGPEDRGHPGRGEPGQRCARRPGPSPAARSAGGPRAWPARAAGLVRPAAAAPRRSSGPEGQQGPGAAVGLVPVLDVPAPPAGDGGQPGLGVDRHREADRLEHGQVAGRVGVGHRLARGRGPRPRRSRPAPGPGPRRSAGAARGGR